MTRWFILPGMGANSSMYHFLQSFVDFHIHYTDWPDYHGEKTFGDIAKSIIWENDIRSEDIVGGSSLGGMIAAEIAHRLDVRAVVLLGSAIKASDVSRILLFLSLLSVIFPIALAQKMAGKINSAFFKMFASCEPMFIRAMCLYLKSWKSYRGPMKKVYRLHGENDRVITCPSSGCDVVRGAGHLLAITHPEETGKFVCCVNTMLTGGQTHLNCIK